MIDNHKYLEKIISHPNIIKAEFNNNNIIAYSSIKEKEQLAWKLLCLVYDREFTKYVNNIIIL